MLGFGKKVLRPFTYGSRVKNGYCTRTHTLYMDIYILGIYMYYIFFNLILYYEFLSFLSVPETSSRQHNLHLFLNAAKGSRFTLGVWGLGRVRSMPLSRSQYTRHFTLHNPPLHTLHTTFRLQHSIVFTLHTLHSTPFHAPQSTLVR